MENQKNDLLKHPRIQHVLDTTPLLLRTFPPEDCRKFLRCGKLREYSTGDTIVSEDNKFVNDGWLITDGSVSFFKENVYVTKLRPGDFIGETFLFKNRAPSGTLVAALPTAVIRFEREAVLQFFERHSDQLFKIFILNLIDLQNQKLIFAGKKLLYIHRKLAYQSKLDA